MAYELATVIILLGVVGFLSYFAKSIENDHSALKLGFFLLAFFFALLTLHYGRLIADSNAANANILGLFDTAYLVLMGITVFVTFYVLIYYFIGLLNFFKFKKEKRNQGESEDE